MNKSTNKKGKEGKQRKERKEGDREAGKERKEKRHEGTALTLAARREAKASEAIEREP